MARGPGFLESAVSMRSIVKEFGATRALDAVDFHLRPGEVVALVGANGAGKSTLIKILAGVYRADAGSIAIDGIELPPGQSPARIGFIHQELGLVGQLTVAENMALTTGYPQRFTLISWRDVEAQSNRWLDEIGVNIDSASPVNTLSAAEQSLIAIARALALRPSVLVLDEPTASLPAADVEVLFKTLRELRAQGLAILYVSHRLEEVFRIADRVCVLRDGRVVAQGAVSDFTHQKLVEAITGSALQSVDALPTPRGPSEALRVIDLVSGDIGPISFSLNEGEILALVGLRGAGHEAIGHALFGDTHINSGTVLVRGASTSIRKVRDALHVGIGMVPGSRLGEGLMPGLTVRENLNANPALHDGRWRWVNTGREKRWAKDVVAKYNIRPPEPELIVDNLSGGNQQKTMVSRWVESEPRILIMNDPTAGIDVGAKAEIYSIVNRLLQKRVGVLMISSDFEEVALIAHRAAIFHRGQIVAVLGAQQISEASLTDAATRAI